MSRKINVAEVAGRPYWCETEARVMVKAWRSSGGRLSRFARRHGVDPRRLSRWASRLEGSEPAPMRFHPVRLAEGGGGQRDGRAIEIELGGGRCVRVPHGFEAEDLRRVLAVLEEAARC
jgi:transposase-like protein